ncbi:MAG: AbrB/MazE/SpoVT family DNA-binding domain-containing protein [Candidatus Woesearchaeota archaeon]
MAELFKAKVRRIGSSLGVLIPKEVAEAENVSEGEEVEISLLKQRRFEEVMKAFGIARGAKPFQRDKTDRLDRWSRES